MKLIVLFLLFILQSSRLFSQDSSCSVNLNTDTTFQLSDPAITLEFNQSVIPSLFYMPLEHNRAYGTYYIPFDTIAKVTGLYSLIGKTLIHPCCVCCPKDECAVNVVFTRIGTTSIAKFKIEFKNVGQRFYTPPASVVNKFTFTLKTDTVLTGYAIISPNFIRFYMEEPRIMLKVQNDKGNVLDDIEIQCISISPNRIVYMPKSQRPFAGTELPLIIYKN